MLKILEIKGRKVYYEKNEIGNVENAIVDYRTKRITSLIIKPLDEKGIVFLSKINNLEIINDMVYLKNEPYRVNMNSIKKAEVFFITNLFGKSVYDKDKREIGSIVDIVLEKNSGDIIAFIVSMGFYDDLITGRKLVFLKKEDLLKNGRAFVEGSNIEMINQISLWSF
ncbi:PRC-barrel domain protein [Caloramator mitchellensis]|uniref:PRC-barrel domain protein n=1 Tax=Caloramator mitchellensis TaxID=908809 RepID=A0A0R3K045_CALMK|nr:PRC-barrel domain-containing protein [Caloramator mitchellensis]KRQ86878.1 PRC-barrel domain protein [Caloramator mitchellensis]